MKRTISKVMHFTPQFGFAVALSVLCYPTASIALGTADERAACTPEVFRLCSSEIPNVDRIITCLKKQKNNLKPDCRAVFNKPETATRSIGSTPQLWCNFRNSDLDPKQQQWIQWCGKDALK